jgi:magnesium-transporting ATPase (P-type)
VLTAYRAGINVRMITGDLLETAVSIARECNILPTDYTYIQGDNVVMTGVEFSNQIQTVEETEDEKTVTKIADLDHFREVTKDLKVMCQASYKDKFVLVTGLK